LKNNDLLNEHLKHLLTITRSSRDSVYIATNVLYCSLCVHMQSFDELYRGDVIGSPENAGPEINKDQKIKCQILEPEMHDRKCVTKVVS